MKYLSVDQVIRTHDAIIKSLGGLEGIHDRRLLESAIHAPQTQIFGQEMYPSLGEKTAVYLYHLIKNHPFNDGNKRTALTCALIFLKVNGGSLPEDDDLDDLCVDISDGIISKEELIKFFGMTVKSI